MYAHTLLQHVACRSRWNKEWWSRHISLYLSVEQQSRSTPLRSSCLWLHNTLHGRLVPCVQAYRGSGGRRLLSHIRLVGSGRAPEEYAHALRFRTVPERLNWKWWQRESEFRRIIYSHNPSSNRAQRAQIRKIGDIRVLPPNNTINPK